MNIHISEVLSDILEPMVDAYEGGQEIISTEDCKARIENLNEANKDWDKWKWWSGKRTNDEKFECCLVCTRKYEDKGMRLQSSMSMSPSKKWMGEEIVDVTMSEIEKYKCDCVSEEERWRTENWEKFWDTPEGQDTSFWTRDEEDNVVVKTEKTIAEVVKRLRRKEWVENHAAEDIEDVDKTWEPQEVLSEDIQDFERNMVVIGSDVEALYPSLDIEDCTRIIEEEVERTKIKWEDLDYVEGTRLIVLNRSALYCRGHQLSRVLPVRRKRTGVRPGVTGKGPLGPERGDTEQWVWPRVKLTEEERTMVIAEVVKILAEVMFQNHLYTFGGQVYRQKRGGPIGLRGTCALARLTMCNWDRLWEELMKRNRVTLEEYMRYMDDDRSFFYPFRTG